MSSCIYDELIHVWPDVLDSTVHRRNGVTLATMTYTATHSRSKFLECRICRVIFLVIDHSDLKTMNKYLGLFHDAVEKGYMPMNDLVTMEDRMLMNAGKPQKYGTQAYSLVEDGKTVIYIWPVEDPDKLDALRKSVGLIPIEDYLEIVRQQGSKAWKSSMTRQKL